MKPGNILVVDDENDIRATISEILVDEGYEVRVAGDATAAREAVRRARPDLILLDVWMPDTDGITLLREWAAVGEPRCPVVMLSGHGTVETAVEATRLGAVDFVEKPLSLAKLLRTVQQALVAPDGAGARAARSLVPDRPSLVGRSAAMRELREQAAAVARRPEPVLIVGESGVGRSLLARYIHELGDSRSRPLVTLVAPAVPEGAVANTLLGAGTDAAVEPGCFERAAGGTLYVSDVQLLCSSGQKLLAGVLEQGSYAPLGRAGPVPLQCRLIASLAPDTAERIRPELLAQLAVLELRVPPLRERSDDLPELLRHSVERLVDAERFGYRRFGLAAQNRLRMYPWPGNVRELENLVRRLLVAGGAEEISLAELERHLESATGSNLPLVKQDLLSLPLREAREHFERAYLTQQLALCGGRVGALAKRVGMERTHLYRKLRQLGVDIRQVADDD
jgi:DNA-binding NtrC family response regulator